MGCARKKKSSLNGSQKKILQMCTRFIYHCFGLHTSECPPCSSPSTSTRWPGKAWRIKSCFWLCQVWADTRESSQTLLATSCGNVAPRPITTPGNVFTAVFQSQEAPAQGFSASFVSRKWYRTSRSLIGRGSMCRPGEVRVCSSAGQNPGEALDESITWSRECTLPSSSVRMEPGSTVDQ